MLCLEVNLFAIQAKVIVQVVASILMTSASVTDYYLITYYYYKNKSFLRRKVSK